MTTISATYSPEDNKIRLYASARLDAETFQRVKDAGFKWAPKQELFVAPSWSCAREDLALELAGEIEPEEMTLAERAQMKADRLDAIRSATAPAGRRTRRGWWVVGGAGMKEIVKRIMDGDKQLPVNVTYPPALISSAIEMTALRFVSKAPMTGRFIIGSELITPENASQFYYPDSPF